MNRAGIGLVVSAWTSPALPLHPLIVHAVVVSHRSRYSPCSRHVLAAARRLGIVTPLAALVVLVLVPITVSGLARRASAGSAVERHVTWRDAPVGDRPLRGRARSGPGTAGATNVRRAAGRGARDRDRDRRRTVVVGVGTLARWC